MVLEIAQSTFTGTTVNFAKYPCIFQHKKKPQLLSLFGNSGLFMPICLQSQPSCDASVKFTGSSNLLNGEIFKMSNLKLSQPSMSGVHFKYK